MRIISGKARGTKLNTLKGENTRPTLDSVKESLFNIIQNDLRDAIFLDLFSGSGSIGLEAISRNAKKVVMCDNSKEAIEIIKTNLEKLKFEKDVKIYNMSAEKLLEEKLNEQFDVIYIDPPYIMEDIISNSLKTIIDKKLIHNNSKIIIETDREKEILEKIETINIEVYDKRKYGRVSLIFLKKK